MSDHSPNLTLPYIMASQAQKHVTHNEAIRALDAVVQLAVEDRDLTAAPANPADGARYLVAAGAGGAWAGMEGRVAAWQDGAWMFYAPEEGWTAWVRDEDGLVAWDGSGWVAVGGGSGSVNPVALVGVNTSADPTNRLAVSSPASLFNHEGAGHQQKINKAAAGDTASVLYQTGFSGRAEAGLAGDDDFHLKVSPDGANWHEALVAYRQTGIMRLAKGCRSGWLTIGDDAFATIPMVGTGSLFFIWATSSGAYPDGGGGRYAIVFADTGLSLAAVPVILDSAGTAIGTGAATGTRGADGNLTVFVDVGALHVENRRGGTREYGYMVMQ